MCAKEDISDGDTISRLVEFPRTYDAERDMILEAIFEFPNGDGESVVWRNYAATPSDVHKLGIDWEIEKRERKPDMRYVGFIDTRTRDVRAIRTRRGYGFMVEHDPSNGQGQHHAEIRYGATYRDMKKADRGELKISLRGVFGALVRYARPAPAGTPATAP